jgi:hypothetical protein
MKERSHGGAMNERQKIRADLKRYQLLRELITDERTLAVINALIGEIGDRLAELEDGRSEAAASGP